MLKVPGEVILQREAPGQWVIANVRARTALGGDSAVVELLGALGSADGRSLDEQFAGRQFQVWDIERFTNAAGLLADPTRRLRPSENWPPATLLGLEAALQALQDHFLVITDEATYQARFGPKRSLLDGERFGNFHQQLGFELLIKRREQPENWWLQQKFNADFQGLRNNLYQAVQANYLEAYFPKRIPAGSQVVDVGCGIGYYANMLARHGAQVVGVDPNAAYIEIARQHAAPGARFEVMPVGQAGGLDALPTASADFAFMSDALLFYFVAERPTQMASLEHLMTSIRRILKPGGVFISMEPHYLFWLAPWLGEEDQPFTIFTEYQTKTFGVTATFSQLIQAYTQAGFAVIGMDEALPNEAFAEVDRRAYQFARNFPLWQIFELSPR